MYVSTAFITGLFILAMLAFTPQDKFVGKVFIALISLGIFVGSLPWRKGLALAFDDYMEARSEKPRVPE